MKSQYYILHKRNVTIDDIKPPDKHNGYPKDVPRWFSKLFEVIPGLITVLFLIFPFWAAFTHHPEVFVLYIAFLTVFWTVRGMIFTYGVLRGIFRYNHDIKIDWMKKIEEENLDDSTIQYVLVYPLYHEGFEIIYPSLKAWSESTINTREKFHIVFAVEERYAEEEKQHIKKAMSKLGSKFKEHIIVVHPNNIDGEIKGVKTGNINWATRYFVDVLRERGENIEDYLLISCDSDQIPHRQYLAAITYKYLTVPKPKRSVFVTALHTFNNNIFEVPVLIRMLSQFITFAILYRWGLRSVDGNETFSAYVVNLKTVEDSYFWDPQLENDDSVFYWNALVRFNGDFKAEAVFIPTYNDAVQSGSALSSYRALWKQQVRWGWGTVLVPMLLTELYANKNLSFLKKVAIAARVFDDRMLFRTAVILLTFGLPVLGLISPEYRYSSMSYNMPIVVSFFMNIALLSFIPTLYVRRRITPLPKKAGVLRNILDLAEILLLVVVLLTFGFLPATQAQIELWFRKGPKTEHYVTEKVRSQK